MKTCLETNINNSIHLLKKLPNCIIKDYSNILFKLKKAVKSKNKIFFFGNGGSAAESQHLSAELTVKLTKKRKPIPSIAISADAPSITATANDFNFNYIFERQIEALSNKGDVVIALSTSGKSKNVINALKTAKKIGCVTILFTGNNFPKHKFIDYILKIPSNSVARIQESHLLIGHSLIQDIESSL